MPHHDADLAALLPEITGPGGQFRHRQHIHLAFLAVRRYVMPEATARICDWIQRIAAYERAPQKYHHTVSRAWVELVAHQLRGRQPLLDVAQCRGQVARGALDPDLLDQERQPHHRAPARPRAVVPAVPGCGRARVALLQGEQDLGPPRRADAGGARDRPAQRGDPARALP